MDFSTAIKTCFSKYVDFSGRAQRSEFWYFVLFSWFLHFVAGVVAGSEMASGLISLGLFLPGLAVGVRRLHDTDRSGWWFLLWLIPILGWIILIVFMAKEGDRGENQYGHDPLDRSADPHERARYDMDAEPASRQHSTRQSAPEGGVEENFDDTSNQDNPWVKVRREKAAAEKVEEAAIKKQAQETQRRLEEEKKRRTQPPKFGRDAAKKNKKD